MGMNSPVHVSCIPYMTNNNNKNKNNKNNSKVATVKRGNLGGRTSAVAIKTAGAAYNTQITNTRPVFYPASDGIRIRHREYIGEVGTNVSGFDIVSTLSINPGLPAVFPWLSMLAQNFELYEIHKMDFIFQSTMPTSTAGSYFMSLDYDAADAAPPTKAAMMSNMSAISCSIWSSCVLSYEAAMNKFMVNRYTRNTYLASNLDVKTYDAATLYIAVDGAITTSPGNFYIEYDITLRIPQIPPSLELAQSQKVYYGSNTALSNTNDGWGGNALISSLAGSIAAGNFQFNYPGQYLLEYTLTATATGAGNVEDTWSITSGDANVTALSSADIPASAVSAVGIYQAVIEVIEGGARFSLALSHIASIASWYFRVSKYGYSLA
jgi:hypothetical protein